ncbi:MAG: helix-turn-helix domain-containing protein [Bacteroidia bacterium]
MKKAKTAKSKSEGGIGERLRKFRVHRKLSQQEVADGIGLEQSLYGRKERDETEVYINELVKLAAFYKVTLDELVSGGEVQDLPIQANIARAKVVIEIELNTQDIFKLDLKDKEQIIGLLNSK